ncbi:AraC family transcriptional regulator [Maricaulis sp.]|uniref:AraC family transcriptional regulator n=1 Tax=Maricaulis sp. TaxID=1486257 RepID=UPI002B26791C|nr:AraC family transcriptional regulator [Maricaulis sp.]
MPLDAALPVQRFRADIVATAFSPHRHDTYTFALTTRGVQDFDYRGATRRSQPGAVVVLHPDELHDGRPGAEGGFGYAGLNILPEILARHRPGGGLPFLPGGVSRDPALINAVRAMLDLPPQADALDQESALIDLALALDCLSDAPVATSPVTRAMVEAACDHIRAHSARGVSLDELEGLTGLDRWQLSRDFRTLRGTSPARYLTQRRLDQVRQAIAGGDRLADAAQDAGFVDQAHMSRHFKAAYGITPGQFARTIIQDPAPSHRHPVLH